MTATQDITSNKFQSIVYIGLFGLCVIGILIINLLSMRAGVISLMKK